MAHAFDEEWEEVSTPRSSGSVVADDDEREEVLSVNSEESVQVPVTAVREYGAECGMLLENDGPFSKHATGLLEEETTEEEDVHPVAEADSASVRVAPDADEVPVPPDATPDAADSGDDVSKASGPDTPEQSDNSETPISAVAVGDKSSSVAQADPALPVLRTATEAEDDIKRREQEAWMTSSQLEDDIRYASKAIPEVERQWQEYTLSILLLGGDGSGKTTCAKNLFMSFYQGKEYALPKSSQPAGGFDLTEPGLKSVLPIVSDEVERVRYRYVVHDTPAFDSSDPAHQAEVLAHLMRCNYQHYAAESDLKKPRSEIVDCRIDVVLYFLPPNRPSAADIACMSAIGEEVSLIPVVAKSDCLTPEEVEDVRQSLMAVMTTDQQAGSNGVRAFRFSDAALKNAGVMRPVPPFALICSSTMDESVHSCWAVRRYRWGTVEAFRERDSDLKYLKKLLLEEGLLELKAATEARYRAQCGVLAEPDRAPSVEVAACAKGSRSAAQRRVWDSSHPAQRSGRLAGSGAGAEDGVEVADDFCCAKYVRATVREVEKMSSTAAYRLTLFVSEQCKIITLRIGTSEGCCMLSPSRSPPPARPCTYDTWKAFITGAASTVKRAVITDCLDTIFYSELHFADAQTGVIRQKLDARPSDAINMALRFDAPIFIDRAVVASFGKELRKP